MRIGLDFDNTIIDYNNVFRDLAIARSWLARGDDASKQEIKARLLSEDGNDLRWQELQALAYSSEILKARAFEGFDGFLTAALERGHELFIVSHKTETSNFDPSARLRDAARLWIAQNQLPIPSDRIFFENTQDEKVARITALELDAFVDDLAEVLEHPGFPGPATTTAVLFAPEPFSEKSLSTRITRCASWEEIGAFIKALGTFQKALGKLPTSSTFLRRTGNNRLYRVLHEAGRELMVKQYYAPSPNHPSRAQSEFDAASLLWSRGIRQIAEPVYFDCEQDSAVYAFLPGNVIPASQATDAQIGQCAGFLSELRALSSNLVREHETGLVGLATDSRFTYRQYLDALDRRLARIERGVRGSLWEPQARMVLDGLVLPLKETLTERLIRRAGPEFETELAPTARMLSPSDFGFHNALVDERGNVRFIDFEYFGWDDPAKLFADIFHSVAQDLRWEQKWLLLDRFSETLGDRAAFVERWETIVDVIGLEWVLIVLNVLDPEVMLRRKFAAPGLNEAKLVRERLLKARDMVESTKGLNNNSNFATIPDRKRN